MALPGVALTGTSGLLVSLIVLLRLLMLKLPLSYRSVHKQVSGIACIVAWVLPLLLSSITFIGALPPFYDVNVYNTFVTITNQLLVTFPILLTVLLYVMLMCSLNQQTSNNEGTMTQMKALASMTRGVVVGLLICNVPGLLYLAYLINMQSKGRSDEFFTSNVAVRIVN